MILIAADDEDGAFAADVGVVAVVASPLYS